MGHDPAILKINSKNTFRRVAFYNVTSFSSCSSCSAKSFFLKKREVWEDFPKLPVAEAKAIVFLDTFGHIICHQFLTLLFTAFWDT